MKAVAAGLLLTGCFYLDPIVPRPGVTINNAAPPYNTAYRGNRFLLTADFDNPQPHQPRYAWLAFACRVSDDRTEVCDDSDFYSGSEATASFVVPVATGAFPPALVNRLKVKLQVHDDRGAVATAEENIEVLNGPPTLELGVSATSFSVGVPIDLFAKYGDPDDPLDQLVLLAPEVTTPKTPLAYTLEDLPPAANPFDTTHVVAGKRLTPGEPGAWNVKLAVRDPVGELSPAQSLAFVVNPDQPPCLARWEPIVPPAGAALPIFEPTVFQVPLVHDELDAYPPLSSAPQFGTTTFAWSILAPGAPAREVLAGATGNRIDFDPAAFTPGDMVEIRVEIADRHRTALPCNDSAATCSITGAPDCLQRQTWRVEVR